MSSLNLTTDLSRCSGDEKEMKYVVLFYLNYSLLLLDPDHCTHIKESKDQASP